MLTIHREETLKRRQLLPVATLIYHNVMLSYWEFLYIYIGRNRNCGRAETLYHLLVFLLLTFNRVIELSNNFPSDFMKHITEYSVNLVLKCAVYGFLQCCILVVEKIEPMKHMKWLYMDLTQTEYIIKISLSSLTTPETLSFCLWLFDLLV